MGDDSCSWSGSDLLKYDVVRALPENFASKFFELFLTGDDGKEMVARELASFAGETGGAVGEKYFGFALASGIEQELASAGIAGVVLKIDADLEVSQWYPGGFAAPASVDQFILEGQQFAKDLAGERGVLFFQTGNKGKLLTYGDTQCVHFSLFFLFLFCLV